jgi:hypothetical protein
MIQIIGIMVAFYIITRMLHLLIDKSKEINAVTMISAILTLLIAAYSLYALATTGASISRSLLE